MESAMVYSLTFTWSPLRRRLVSSAVIAPLLLAGCSGTGQPEIAYEVFVAPAPAAAITAGAWTVTLDEATVAFGPAYFCAAASGSATLCDVAVSELRGAAAFDALGGPQPLGSAQGFAGQVRSASYDYGISWLLTGASPRPAPAAPGGRSARFAGSATRGAETVRFLAEIEVLAQYRGQRAVPTTPADAELDERVTRLDIALDAGAWLTGVDFDEVATIEGDPKRIELGTDDASTEARERAHNAIVIAMVSTRPPTFTWSGPAAP
jgi:hypothetical protein